MLPPNYALYVVLGGCRQFAIFSSIVFCCEARSLVKLKDYFLDLHPPLRHRVPETSERGFWVVGLLVG